MKVFETEEVKLNEPYSMSADLFFRKILFAKHYDVLW